MSFFYTNHKKSRYVSQFESLKSRFTLEKKEFSEFWPPKRKTGTYFYTIEFVQNLNSTASRSDQTWEEAIFEDKTGKLVVFAIPKPVLPLGSKFVLDFVGYSTKFQ